MLRSDSECLYPDKRRDILKKAIYITLLALCLTACGSKSQNGGTNNTETTAVAHSEATKAEDIEVPVFSAGDTWTVDGQWTLTVTGVQETGERNQYSNREPAAVYIVSCEYENLGYTDSSGILSGLVFSLDESIVDSERYMGYSYPGTIINYPQETPVGAKCKAQYCIGVDNAGDFKLNVEKFDGNNVKQCATFAISTQGIEKISEDGDSLVENSNLDWLASDKDWEMHKFITYPKCYVDKNVYAEPDKKSKLIGFIPVGDTVTEIGRTNDENWVVIEWKDDVGFIEANDVHE